MYKQLGVLSDSGRKQQRPDDSCRSIRVCPCHVSLHKCDANVKRIARWPESSSHIKHLGELINMTLFVWNSLHKSLAYEDCGNDEATVISLLDFGT